MVRGLDLGGSRTRIAATRTDIKEFTSFSTEIPINAPVKDYISDIYSDFKIEMHPMKSLEGRRFVKGEATNHYHGTALICDNQTNKVDQEAIYANATYAIAVDMLQRDERAESMSIGVSIPTSEFYSDIRNYPELFKDCMAGKHVIYFPLCNQRIAFNVAKKDIRVMPEGVIAAYKYRTDPVFKKGIVLIVDVGYRSTDITILNRFMPIGKSAVSRPHGGMNLEASIRGELERGNILISREELQDVLSNSYVIRNGEAVNITENPDFAMSSEERDKAMASYYLNHNNEMKDITDIVTNVKKSFVSTLKDDITDVLSAQMLNLASINAVLTIGRPFDGEPTVETNLTHLLAEELGGNLHYYQVPNLSTANVEEIIGVMSGANNV